MFNGSIHSKERRGKNIPDRQQWQATVLKAAGSFVKAQVGTRQPHSVLFRLLQTHGHHVRSSEKTSEASWDSQRPSADPPHLLLAEQGCLHVRHLQEFSVSTDGHCDTVRNMRLHTAPKPLGSPEW